MIQIERIKQDIETIAAFTQTPGNGATRPTFTKEWAQARDYIATQAKLADCEVHLHPSGNLHARPKSLRPNTPAFLSGSHIDTVPHGGNYDGVAGVVSALEILRSANDDSWRIPLELIIFAEEEGPTFGVGMLGSRAWTGDLRAEDLAKLKNAGGETYLEAGLPSGVDPNSLAKNLLNPQNYRAFIEIHIEQGPGMWQRDQRLAVVRAIAGRHQLRAEIIGQANHAGATSMTDRRDALAGASEIIVGLEALAKSISPETVITVGRVEVQPNAVNVIPEKVEFTIDLRAPDTESIAKALEGVKPLFKEKLGARGLKFAVTETEAISPCPMDPGLCSRLAELASAPMTVSGALHDSAVIARHVPTVMLFVPSKDGISHNSAEFSRVEDIAAAASLVEKFIRRQELAHLNQLTEDEFASLCGPMFEHSSWIATRAWRARPFSSISDLHQKMTAVVDQATADEKVSLINAHPDLVGRLAGEGKLTAESAREQAAAGLNLMSPGESMVFGSYNRKYRDKFGFPFIICARQNKKEAILAAFPRRLNNSREEEIATALSEIFKIAQLRLNDAFWEK
jgi:allantoate deiminase